MARPKKTAAELRAENRLLRQSNTALTFATLANNLIRWGSVAFIAWCAYRSIDSLAGRDTAANVIINFLGTITVSQSVAYILGAGGIIYGARERSLRQKNVDRLQGRIQTLEKERDPGRSSSKLTSKGETNPKDKE